ncbi:MAG TPA: hypothetical protein VGK38_05750, partial [Prolixibacteraceae bacterium]
MNLEKKNWFESASWHKIYLTSLFIITAIVLYFALPQEGRFPYEFQKGRPWMHATLIAPYNFAIMKSDMTIVDERDSLLKSLTPYFLFHDSIGKQQIANLSSKIDEITLNENTEILYSRIVKNKVLTIFDKIYNSGILEETAGNYPPLAGKSELLIVKNNLAEKVPTGQLYSLKTAYSEANAKLDLLKKSDPDLKKIIDKLHAEEYLAVNLTFDAGKTKGEEQKILENLSTTNGVVQ